MPSNQANLAQIEQKRAQLEIIIAKIPDLSGYTMRFVILTRDASAQKNQGEHKAGYRTQTEYDLKLTRHSRSIGFCPGGK